MGYYAAGGYYSAGGNLAMMPSHGPDPALSHSSSSDAGGRRRGRMNPMNVSAARRSIRRLQSFERIARKVITFTKGHPPGHGKFKAKGHRR
jgi:hypothetical protein